MYLLRHLVCMTCRGSPEPLFKSTLLFIQFSKEAGRGIGSISPKAVPIHRQTTKIFLQMRLLFFVVCLFIFIFTDEAVVFRSLSIYFYFYR
jgi:hypothetical protein